MVRVPLPEELHAHPTNSRQRTSAANTERTPPAAELFDKLPVLNVSLADAPESLLRQLIELLQLTIQLEPDLDSAVISIILPADDLPDLAQTTERIMERMPNTRKPASAMETGKCVDPVGAPGRIRTCAHGSGGGGFSSGMCTSAL
ncbi:hypothetical protein AB0M28_10690 [Streptomyces sp. NPDC051940]|uniref:hypothetical protein n=1 Tax=Streptomyces sp. NPDC051940 TaxID=3155675 RepID=UPI003444074E